MLDRLIFLLLGFVFALTLLLNASVPLAPDQQTSQTSTIISSSSPLPIQQREQRVEMQSSAAARMQSDNRGARMIHELSRNLKYAHSAASSTGSNHGTVSPDDTLDTMDTAFDPIRDEACNSTGIFPQGFDPTVPEIHRAMLRKMQVPRSPNCIPRSKKYRRWAQKPQAEYDINNSAIANAFADFSSGPLEIVTVSDSLETGRGPVDQRSASNNHTNNSTHNITNNTDRNIFSNNPKQHPTSNILKQAKDQNVFHTPKKTQSTQIKSSNILQNTLRNNAAQKEYTPSVQNMAVEQKENVPPSTQKSKTRSPYVSNASRTFTGERRSVAELQARVTDGSQDGSMVVDDRPANIAFQPRSSRFSKIESRASQHEQHLKPQLAQIFSRKETIKAVENSQRVRNNIQDTPTRAPSKNPVSAHATNYTVATNSENPTQKSFIIPPPLPLKASETGTQSVVDQGVPVQVRSGRVQNRQTSSRGVRQLSRVDDMDADQEEEDLYAMLDESRDKNAELEMLLITAQSTILKLQNEKISLTLENEHLQARERSDSALGESDGEGSKKQRLVEVEIKRLTSEVVSLQNLVDQTQRTMSNQELLLKAKSADCEQALKQASQCHDLIRNLRQENESFGSENIALKEEIEDLNSQLAQAVTERESFGTDNNNLRTEIDKLNNQLAHNLAAHESLNKRNIDLENENQDLQTQLAQIMDERDALTHTSKSKETSLERQVDQLIVERHRVNLTNQKVETDLKDQIHQLLLQNDENTHIWETKETALLSKVRRQEDIIRVLQDRSNKILEATQNLDGKISQKSSSCPEKSKIAIKSSKSDCNISSKAVKQAQHQNDEFDVGSTEFSSKHGHQPSTFLKQPQNRLANRLSSNSTVSQHDEFGDNTVEIHPIDPNITQDTFNSSNFSSELGHGYMENLRRTGRNLKALETQYDEAAAIDDNTQDMTVETIHSGRNSRIASIRSEIKRGIRDDTIQSAQLANSSHAPSLKDPASILKNSKLRTQEDFKSQNSNLEHVSGSNHYRHSSEINESHPTTTNILHRRHNSDISGHTSHRNRSVAEDITSALLVEDILAAKQNDDTKEHPVLSTDARRVLDGLCRHNCRNCTICARLAAFEIKSVKIHKPIPVSERMPEYEDEPTLRPSVSPGDALATVIKGLEEEVAHLKMKQAEMQELYMKHDASLGKRQRKTLKQTISNLLNEIERKSEQVYALYDVLEGQKQSGQEMTKDDLDITLTKFGIDVTVEQEAPWEGIVDDE